MQPPTALPADTAFSVSLSCVSSLGDVVALREIPPSPQLPLFSAGCWLFLCTDFVVYTKSLDRERIRIRLFPSDARGYSSLPHILIESNGDTIGPKADPRGFRTSHFAIQFD